jgi:hypothetical protein
MKTARSSPPDTACQRRPVSEPKAPQRITLVRRDYNGWVASETMEDYALRFTPQRFRKWSEWRVANTAFGAAVVSDSGGVRRHAAGAIRVCQRLLGHSGHRPDHFPGRLPISVYAARYGVDMDLLTRGAGFWLHRLHHHLADLRLVHLHLFSRWRRPSWPMRWNWHWAYRRAGAT